MWDHVSNNELLDMVREKSSWSDIAYADTEIRKCRWRYIGHVLRRPEARIVRRAMFSQPPWTASRGRPKTNWKTTAFTDLKSSTCAELAAIAVHAKRWGAKVEATLKHVSGHTEWNTLCSLLS